MRTLPSSSNTYTEAVSLEAEANIFKNLLLRVSHSSERDFESELNLSGGRGGRRNKPGGRVGRATGREDNRVGSAQVGPVESVEELGPELQAGLLGHREVLQ